MRVVKSVVLSVFCASSLTAALADPSSGGDSTSTAPKEVGTTTMNPGNYTLTDQSNQKTYNLMVTDKGSMILGPGSSSGAAAATSTTTTSTFDKKKILEKGMESGATELFKKEALKGL